MAKQIVSKQNLNKPVTLGVLLEYTDEFLIPKISDVMDKKITQSEQRIKKYVNDHVSAEVGRLNHDLKTYIDSKLADYTSDIFKRLDKKYQKDRDFKQKIVELFKKK